MQMQLAIYAISTNQLLADWSTRVLRCNVRTGAHGYESCTAELAIPFLEAFLYYQQLGPLKLKVNWGSYRVWEGRLEDPTQFAKTTVGLQITAFGGWVAYNDAPYIALWSDITLDKWRMMTSVDAATRTPEKYAFSNQSELFVGLVKNTTYTLNVDIAQPCYQAPDGNSRGIVGISFDYSVLLPNNWQLFVQSFDSTFTFVQNNLILTANGALQTGSVNLAGLTSCQIISFLVYNNAATAVYAGETGVNYFRASNIRIVTSTANRISTSLTANRAAGANVTATVGSTAGMYVGQKLQIKAGTVNGSETVTVLSIGSSTQFNATFVNNYVIGDGVTAHVVYPDEVYKDCVAALNTLNSTQVASDTALIQSQTADIDQAIFEDEYPTDIINKLLAKADNQTPPRQWVALVYDDQRLIVRPRGSGTAWYTDITSLEVVRTLTQLYNSVYAVYKDVNSKRNLRTAANTDSASVTKFGITRRKAVKVDTTNSVQASKVRDAVLALQLDPVPRANVSIDRVFDVRGLPFPLFMVRADDTLTLRNLPPTLAATLYDKIRTLVITRTDVDMLAGSISLELEVPLPDIDVQLALALKGNA